MGYMNSMEGQSRPIESGDNMTQTLSNVRLTLNAMGSTFLRDALLPLGVSPILAFAVGTLMGLW